MIQNCVICGTEFCKNKFNQIYCSKVCKGKSQNLNSVVNCVICGTKFTNVGHTTTCSIECSKQDRIDYMKQYRATPEYVVRRSELRAIPETKQKAKEYLQRPDVIERTERVMKEYHQKNKELYRLIDQNRRIRKLGNGGTYSVDDWLQLTILLGKHCLVCWKNNIKLTIDHIIPISKGGTNFISNLQPLCKSCNCKKHNTYDVPNLLSC